MIRLAQCTRAALSRCAGIRSCPRASTPWALRRSSKSTSTTTRTHRKTSATTASPIKDSAKVTTIDVLPQDGLPRYPQANTLGSLRLLDYVGTMSFAYSGGLLAATSGMDMLGASLVGTVTAIGGGTIRDGLLLNKPPFWTEEIEYLYLALGTALCTFGLVSLSDPPAANRVETLLEVGLDALGVGAFCVIGAQNGVRAGMPPIVCILCGMATATFGGAVRDVLCRREVRILHSTSDIYATTAVSGASVYLMARRAGAGVVFRVAAGVGIAFAMRMWAWGRGIRLPVWQAPRDVAEDAGGDVE